MVSILDQMLGLLRAGRAEQVPPPPPQPPRMIPGARPGLELCMHPVDVDEADLDTLHVGDEKRVVQLKADGIRALYIDGRIVTREGTPLDCALHCQPALRRLEEAMGMPMFFDGEYVEEGGFNDTISAMRRGTGQGVLWLFDAVPLRSWSSGDVWEMPTVERLGWLKEHILLADSPFVGMLDWWMLDAHDTRAKARELWAEGYEGVMTKDAEAGYGRVRARSWRRCKLTLTAACPVIDTIADENKLKAVLVKSPHGMIRLGRGWSAEEGERIRSGFKMGYSLPPIETAYQLTTGRTRSIRGATFRRLIEGETTS